MADSLVLLDLPGGPDFVKALERVWNRGDAALPLDQRLPEGRSAAIVRALEPSSVIDRNGIETDLTGGRPVEHGDALVVATSGTTGDPKGVVLTHEAVAASAAATSSRLDVRADDHWLACLPLSHVGGLAVVTRALLTGTRLTVLPGFDAAAVQSTEATLVSLVSTALRRIDPTRFRTIVLGGSRPPADRPTNAVTTYGMTETGSGVVYDGRPLDGVEVRIVDGEVRLRCPMLMRCYRDGSSPVVDGWYPTGDLGEWNSDGTLSVAGRRDDLIITGGENVWPEAVEAVLLRHPLVDDVVVRGEPDAEWGQTVIAHVVATGETPTLESIRDFARRHLPAYAAPKRLEIVRAVPRTALGKVIRLPAADR